MVECGGLENRFTGAPGDEGSNPSSSAILLEKAPNNGSFFSFWAHLNNAQEEGFEPVPPSKHIRHPPKPTFSDIFEG